MTRLRPVPASALALVASFCVFIGTTIPSSAQERDNGITAAELRAFLSDEIMARGERREAFRDRLRDDDDDDDESREAMREHRGEMREHRGEGRGRAGRRAEMREFLEEHPFLRERLRERGRERLRERIGERFAERRGDDDGRCFFLTRVLRSEDRDFLVLVRRRVCRD